jgi:hypothetical protein
MTVGDGRRRRRKRERLLGYLIGLVEEIPSAIVTPELVKRCLDYIRPVPPEHDWCRAEICEMVMFLRFAHECPDAMRFGPSVASKDELFEIASTSVRLAALLGGGQWLPGLVSGHPQLIGAFKKQLRDVCQYLEAMACVAAREARGIRTRRAPAEPAKALAAMFAFALLTFFSDRPPTLTSEGPFYRLTADLYEAATGLRDQNLERHCRREFRSQRPAAPLVHAGADT